MNSSMHASCSGNDVLLLLFSSTWMQSSNFFLQVFCWETLPYSPSLSKVLFINLVCTCLHADTFFLFPREICGWKAHAMTESLVCVFLFEDFNTMKRWYCLSCFLAFFLVCSCMRANFWNRPTNVFRITELRNLCVHICVCAHVCACMCQCVSCMCACACSFSEGLRRCIFSSWQESRVCFIIEQKYSCCSIAKRRSRARCASACGCACT